MPLVCYNDASVPVREDLAQAHGRAWERLAKPGTWWSSAERIAIAAETRLARTCALCRARKDAISPFAVDGKHDDAGLLPPAAVEVAHRLATDPGRLSRKWFDSVVSATAIDDAGYVEILGVVARTVAIDAFCSAIGVAPRPLPRPEPGEPSRERPAGLVDEGFWVPVLPHGSELYGGIRYPNVGRAMSLVPAEVRAMTDFMPSHYVEPERVADATYDPGRAIDRAQMELIAARVSALNQCFY